MSLVAFEIQAKVSSLSAVMSQCVALVTAVTSSDKAGGLVGRGGGGGRAFEMNPFICGPWGNCCLWGKVLRNCKKLKEIVNKIYYLRSPKHATDPKKSGHSQRPQTSKGEKLKGHMHS